MGEDISYVGLDVHKSFIQVALLKPDQDVQNWRVPHSDSEVRKLIRTLRKAGSCVLCYEAGPTGYGLSRTLNAVDGFACHVIAPSLIPRKPGDRIKTDRRDAVKLAELLKAGLLTEVHGPTPDEEALRELCRARGAAKESEKRSKQQLSKFLLRHTRRYTEGKVPWTIKHVAWLEKQRFANEWMQRAFDTYLRGFLQARDRVREVTAAVEEASKSEPVQTPVDLLRCFKGIDTITAITVVSELYRFERFTSPRGLMAFLGMTPSEYSSVRTRRGGITKSGNGRVRKILVEAAWNLTRSNKVGPHLRCRRENQPGWAIDIADRAQQRLHKRYWALVKRGKEHNKAVMAIARELVGFIWDVLITHELKTREANA